MLAIDEPVDVRIPPGLRLGAVLLGKGIPGGESTEQNTDSHPLESTCAHDLAIPATRGPNPRRFLTSQNRALRSAGWADSRWFARPGFLHKGVALLALFSKILNRQGCMLPCVMQSDEHGCSGERITHCIEPCRDPHALGLCRLSLRVRVCPAFAARSCSR